MRRFLWILFITSITCGVVEKVTSVSETYPVKLETNVENSPSGTSSRFEGEVDLLSSPSVSGVIDEIKRVEIEGADIIGNGVSLTNITSVKLYALHSNDEDPYPFAEMPVSMDGVTSVLHLSVSDIDLFPFLIEKRFLRIIADVSGITSSELYLKLNLTIIGTVKR